MSSMQRVYKNISSWIRHNKTSRDGKAPFSTLKSI